MSGFRAKFTRRREKPAVDVRDVSKDRVPFLRAFDWVAIALQSFRERPLPSEYATEAIPTFPLFGNARVAEIQFETVTGAPGGVEATLSVVPTGRYRYYLSFSFTHDDIVDRSMQAIRVVSVGGTFPQAPLTDPARDGAAPAGQIFTARGITVPPEGRIGATVDVGLGGAAVLILTGLFVELLVGEPLGDIS